MNIRLLFTIFCLLGVLIPLSEAAETSVNDESAEYFFYRCAACHTVGGGQLTGPDLNKSRQWADSDLKAAVKRMEKNVGALSQAQIDTIVDFLKDPDVTNRITTQKQKIAKKLQAELPPPSFEIGQRIFMGKKALMNKGPACVHCHSFAGKGGSLGPDLTRIKDKIPGIGLQSAIESANFKIMRPIYEKQKITKEESLHLSEYLGNPEKLTAFSTLNVRQVVGLAGAIVGGFMGCLFFLNKKRKGRAHDSLFNKSDKR